MSRRERPRPGRPDRIRELLEAGDHRGAAEEARRRLVDPGADGRDAAAAALASLRPEPGAVAVGLLGVALSVAVVLFTALGAGR